MPVGEINIDFNGLEKYLCKLDAEGVRRKRWEYKHFCKENNCGKDKK